MRSTQHRTWICVQTVEHMTLGIGEEWKLEIYAIHINEDFGSNKLILKCLTTT